MVDPLPRYIYIYIYMYVRVFVCICLYICICICIYTIYQILGFASMVSPHLSCSFI